ncbi:maleylpyruvate isomerase family mycothiol-dependent enzyme [Streptomyces sp. NBC_00094]|uniref:maleylpyruvate isomerase family mycothiol-dependent enzyme n=1 Tax=Streptomyces sp. NBC_00094 TaxID=2903620 RepID=UPI00225BD94A|nr:maleylpyruvate isomerase family mycothiol-dependent enzyme [Streptomyces sp. NBC_00094]MCX5389305.1 maleylpyruvate isomerase family mycothiol-dependent enzyme [Streptomyces sp. NBC_00094]
MSDALLSTLAEALADLVTAVGTGGDEVLDADTAVKWLESTGATLSGLPAADRRALDGLFRAAALRHPEGPWRDELLTVSEGFGLTEDTHAASCAAVAEQTRRFVATVREADPATPVPTCPGWTLADLTRHLGTVHHWAEHLVRTGATTRVHARDLPLDPPADPAAYPGWLAAGAETFVTTLSATDPDTPLWSPGPEPRAGYYPRHLLFEAVVHLADAEIALDGTARPIDAGTAAEGIEHHLATLLYVPWTAERIAHLDRDGELLRLTARDTGAVWTLTLGGGGFTWRRGSAASTARTEPTVSVTGDSGELLLLLHRRYAADDPRFARTGDRALLDAWLTATAL